MDIKAHLKQLCELHGPPGYEAPVRAVLTEIWRPLVDELEVGSIGNLVGIRRGTQTPEGDAPRRRIMLCAHMDEIGLIVSEISGAFARVRRLGGTDERTLGGQAVIVHTASGPLKAVIGMPPLNSVPDDARNRYSNFEEIVLDFGLPADEIAAQVSVGDIVTMDAPLMTLQGERLAGKAMDDRASVAAVTACLQALQTRRHSWDVLAVASVQEEVGLHGARVEAFRLEPDIAIALDVCFAQQPGVNGDMTFRLGSNPPLSLGANFHPALFDAINAAAGRLEMTLPFEPTPADSGTDAWAIQVARGGIPSALINIPIRNMHSTVETVDVRDIERAGRVLAEFIAGLTPDFLGTIVWDKDKAPA